MNESPKIGLLGITQELYDDVVPGITAYQRAFGSEIVAALAPHIELIFPGPARNRAQIEELVASFNERRLDGILVVMLTYAPSLNVINAMRLNRLPILLANLQPEPTAAPDWNMASLTYNQGIHGIQDLANCLFKMGVHPPILSGDWRDSEFRACLLDWAVAARTVQSLHRARIATFGQMPGMGDITADPHDIMRIIGPQVDFVEVGLLDREMRAVKTEDVDAAVAADRANFAVDPSLSDESHRYAATLYLALRRFLTQNGYDAFCVHFDALGKDGRFKQLHMLAASNLMAEGFGYAAEGDILCASLMIAGRSLSDDPHFTEMYAMDFVRNAFLMSHMGEGNWRVARGDAKPRLISRTLRIGGLDDPPTVVFCAEPGPATLASLANIGGGTFRLTLAEGTILDEPPLANVEMPHFYLRPRRSQSADVASAWLRSAGTHHQVLHLGWIARRWKYLCRILGIECFDADRCGTEAAAV